MIGYWLFFCGRKRGVRVKNEVMVGINQSINQSINQPVKQFKTFTQCRVLPAN